MQAFDRADEEDSVRAIILTGNGRAFCAGADLGAEGVPSTTTMIHQRAWFRPTAAVWSALRIFRSKKPVIAAVNGPAVGMGATDDFPCDFRVMAQDARYGFVFAARGIVPDGACSWFLPRIVGISQALDWCLTARLFPLRRPSMRASCVACILSANCSTQPGALRSEISAIAAPVSATITRQMMWRMLGASHPMEAHRVDSLAIAQTGRMADAGRCQRLHRRSVRPTGPCHRAATCPSGTHGGTSPPMADEITIWRGVHLMTPSQDVAGRPIMVTKEERGREWLD